MLFVRTAILMVVGEIVGEDWLCVIWRNRKLGVYMLGKQMKKVDGPLFTNATLSGKPSQLNIFNFFVSCR